MNVGFPIRDRSASRSCSRRARGRSGRRGTRRICGARQPWLRCWYNVHATLAVQVHENHLFAALPLLTLAAAGPPFAPVLAALTVIFTLNLNLFYGISEDVGYQIPRGLTIVDLTVVLAVANCVALVWHALVFKRECTDAQWSLSLEPKAVGPLLVPR